MPLVVLQIIRSNAISMDGSRKITVIILIIAPLAISEHMVLIKYTLEYFDTPKVDAKKPSALVMMDGIDVRTAISMDSRLLSPPIRSVLYRVDISIA